MNILLTGINGFVGSSLAVHLHEAKHQVVGLVRDINHKTKKEYLSNCTIIRGDILNIELIKRIIADYEIGTIYHLAAQSIVKIAHANPVNTYASNITGTINILEAVRQVNQNCKVVIASSDKAYGVHDELPYTENMDVRPDGPYATSKSCADLIAQSYHKEYGIDINIVRCANIYGAGDLNLSRIIPNTITRILKKQEPQVYMGVLQFKRELIHVDDVCRAYMTIAEKGEPGHIYNIGDNEFYTVFDTVKMICSLMNVPPDLELIDRPFTEIPFQYLSSEKLKALGWEKRVGISEGLESTIKWYAGRNL